MIVNTKPEIGQEEIQAQARVLRSGWLARGKECEAFEKEFSDYISPEGKHYYCLFTNSCTSALKMAWKYFEERRCRCYQNLTPNTYCATYASAEEVGLMEDSDSEAIKIATHFGGVKFKGDCDIEDSAHRIEPNDKLVGKIRCYSFHPNKNMTASGGGMFVCENKKIYEKALLWINDGIVRTKLGRFDYTVEAMAGGYEGFDTQAAVGRVQLRKLPEFNRKRNELVKRYNKAFKQEWTGNHIMPLYLENYDEVKKAIVALEKEGISCKSHYPGSNVITLPLFSSMTFKQQDETIRKFNAYSYRAKLVLF